MFHQLRVTHFPAVYRCFTCGDSVKRRHDRELFSQAPQQNQDVSGQATPASQRRGRAPSVRAPRSAVPVGDSQAIHGRADGCVRRRAAGPPDRWMEGMEVLR